MNPDLYVSSDGGVTWEQTLVGSWGVTVADHGGLMVAARDYHQDYSVELMYTCSEGDIWTGFTFTQFPVKVFGVVTEPGEYTTTVRYVSAHAGQFWSHFFITRQSLLILGTVKLLILQYSLML